MKEFRALLKDWLGDRSANSQSPVLGVATSTLTYWLVGSSLPPNTRIPQLAAAMGIDEDELRAVIFLERRARSEGLALALVIELQDGGMARARMLTSAEGDHEPVLEYVFSIRSPVHGGPLDVRVGDVVAIEMRRDEGGFVSPRLAWIAADERQVIELQHRRLAALPSPPKDTCPPRDDGDITPQSNPIVRG